MTTFRSSVCILSALALLGCSGDNDAAAETGEPGDATVDGAASDAEPMDVTADGSGADVALEPCNRTERIVTFETADGVALRADYLPGETSDSPAIVLVHMIPPSWDRTSYPPRVRDALGATGAAVLNVDRRGAGDSEGVAIEAYEGDGGRLDVEAAVSFLMADESCRVDPDRIGLVGASNGTTSVMDYAVAHGNDLPDAAGIAWLSPGGYTENQHSVADNTAVLNAMPILIVYPDDEPWSDQFSDNTPEPWTLLRIVGGAHGTVNFDEGTNEALQLPALVEWAGGL